MSTTVAAIKPLTKAAPKSAEDFANKAPVRRAITPPKAGRVKSGDDPGALGLKLLAFGAAGTGKTLTLAHALNMGYKVFTLITDIGGSGNLTVRNWMRNVFKNPEALKNLRELELKSYQEVDEFLKDPTIYYPEIYDWDPDFIAWDSFSGFQQIDLQQFVGDMTPQRSEGNTKGVSEQRDSGLMMDQQDWGMVRNATVRMMDKFMALNNPVTGKVWHKIVMCHENSRVKSDQSGVTVRDIKEPLLQGAGGKIVVGAFDLILRTYAKTAKDDDETSDGNGRSYWYTIEPGQNVIAKNRGFQIPANMPGNFTSLWESLAEQAGIKRGAVDVNLIKKEEAE